MGARPEREPTIMRRHRLQIRVQTLVGLVALVAVLLAAVMFCGDEPMCHWRAWQVRWGGVARRRAALEQIWLAEGRATLGFMRAATLGGGGAAADAEWQRRGRRRGTILMPILREVAAHDVAPECRAAGLRTLGSLATSHGTAAARGAALRVVLAGVGDGDPSVRAAAIGSLAGLASCDLPATLAALRSGLADPADPVRLAAVREWGMLGVLVPPAQPEAAAALAGILATSHNSPLRVGAVRGLSLFGADARRHPRATGPDVTPALVAALGDPDVAVRRAAAEVLGRPTVDARSRPVSPWSDRRDRLIPPLLAALDDADPLVRGNAALALFALGRRDAALRPPLEEAIADPGRPRRVIFTAALATWQAEDDAADLTQPEPANPSP